VAAGWYHHERRFIARGKQCSILDLAALVKPCNWTKDRAAFGIGGIVEYWSLLAFGDPCSAGKIFAGTMGHASAAG
jgi:hypothetical protein